jgi:hypothetical protein
VSKFRFCRVVLRGSDAVAARCESHAIVNGREVLEMSDPILISAANADHSEAILSKIRADFGVEASSRSTYFCGAVRERSRRYAMSVQTTLGLTGDGLLRDATGPSWQ